MRVLEIGTGTGYHAAVLCAALGQNKAFTIELCPELVSAAGARLAKLGYQPVLRAADGAEGLAEHAPYDRIIVTCAVPAIPAAWISQLAPGGVLLTDLKGGLSTGNLVKLSRDGGGTLSGRFLPGGPGSCRCATSSASRRCLLRTATHTPTAPPGSHPACWTSRCSRSWRSFTFRTGRHCACEAGRLAGHCSRGPGRLLVPGDAQARQPR